MSKFRLDFRQPSLRIAIAIVLVLPIASFYVLLARTAVNLPLFDDYLSVLAFLNTHVQLHSFQAKAFHLLTSQHNEYKLVFENCIFIMQRAVIGHVNFLFLMALGNSFVLFLFILLWRASLVRIGPWQRALMMIPVAYLLFQLQYASTLNWAMGSLQNLPVLFFAFLSLWLLNRTGPASFAAACVAMLLAIASSGNGFVVLLSGGVLLLARRAWRLLLVWSLLGIAAVAFYLFHYNFHSSLSSPQAVNPHHSLLFLRTAYALAFLGASAAGTINAAPAIVLGTTLFAGFFWIWKTRYDRSNPTLFYFCVFLLLSAIGVAAMRGPEGIGQSLASRYRIYSNLSLVMAYLVTLETSLDGKYRDRSLRNIVLPAMALSLLFCALSDIAGYRFLQQRSREVSREMQTWAHPEKQNKENALDSSNDLIISRNRALGIYRPIADVLEESNLLGVYRPPNFP